MPESSTANRIVGAARRASARSTTSRTRPHVGELHRVAEQVGEHLGDPHRVADEHGRGTSLGELEPPRRGPRAGEGGVPTRARRDDARGRELRCSTSDVPGLEAGDVEDVVDQPEQPLAGAVDDADEVVLARVEVALGKHLGGAEHAGQRGAHLVAHVGQEQRLGRAGLLGGASGALELAPQLVALGDVLGGAVHADHLVADDDGDGGEVELHPPPVLGQHGGLAAAAAAGAEAPANAGQLRGRWSPGDQRR